MTTWFLLIFGGSLGTLFRYGLGGLVQQFFGTRFPFGTLVVNVAGCFLIGLFFSLSESRGALSPGSRLLLMTGFCGAFTTFSTFMLETDNLLRGGEYGLMFLNLAGSLFAGFLLFRAGMFLGGRL